MVLDQFACIGADGTIRDNDVKALCNLARHKHTHVKLSAVYASGKKKTDEPLVITVGDAQ